MRNHIEEERRSRDIWLLHQVRPGLPKPLRTEARRTRASHAARGDVVGLSFLSSLFWLGAYSSAFSEYFYRLETEVGEGWVLVGID